MRTIRLRRVGMLLASTLGLLTTMVPSAHATETTVFYLQGTLVLSSGMSYPCISPGPTINLGKCSMPTLFACGGGNMICMTGGNTRSFSVASSVCVGAGASTTPFPPGGEVNTCALAATGVITGSCGPGAGTSSGALGFSGAGLTETTTLVSPSGIQTFSRSLPGGFSWVEVASTWVVTGTVAGGILSGIININQVPTINGTTIGNSCLNKTATQYELGGVLSVTVP